EIVVWATSLHSGKPLAKVRVRAFTAENQAVADGLTDATGLAKLPRDSADGHPAEVLLADGAGSQLTWLDLRDAPLNANAENIHGAHPSNDACDAFLYADRGVYRPGETVRLRAVVRDATLQSPHSFPVEFYLRGPDNRSRGETKAMLDEDGSAGWTLNIPAEAPTGRWTAELRLPGEESTVMGTLAFRVEEFIPDRVHVQAAFDPTGNRAACDKALGMVVHGDYLFGQPAANLPTDLTCRLDPTPFTVPAMDGWTMNDDAEVAARWADVRAGGAEKRIKDLFLDGSGKLHQELSCDELLHSAKSPASNYQGPWNFSMVAAVHEASGRAVADHASIAIDRAERYVAIQAKETASAGNPATFDVKLLHPDGSADAGDADFTIALYRQVWNTSWTMTNGRYACQSTRRLDPVRTTSKVHIDHGIGSFTVTPPTCGEFAVAAVDERTKRTVSMLLTVTGDGWADSISQEHPESLDIVVQPGPPIDLHPLIAPVAWSFGLFSSEKQSDQFSHGQDVRVMVRSPFAGTLLLAMETDHVLKTQVIHMNGSTVTVPMKLDGNCGPNAFITASVVRAVNPSIAWRVHRASGVQVVRFDESIHKINVAIDTPTVIKPEQSLPVRLRLTDSTGQPIASVAATVAVVDEGICQLTRYLTPDPFSYFTRLHALDVKTVDTYASLMPDTDRTGDIGGDRELANDSRHSSPISARRVKSLALISDLLHADANGLVQADFSLPPFVGKARVMAVAFRGDRYGASEQFVTVRSDLVVHSSWPRFAAPGDHFRVPLSIFNSSASGGDAVIHVHTGPNGPLAFDEKQTDRELTVHIGPKQSAEAAFDVIARSKCGVADVQTDVTLGAESFHETISLPVRPASPMITTADARTVSASTPLTFAPPSGMLDGPGQFNVTVSPRPTLNLPQGIDYLNRYPYGCAEQTTSVAFPLVYLPDLDRVLGGPSTPKDEIATKVQAAIDRLVVMQNGDGALPMWTGGNDWPWVSVYAAHFCTVARQAGYEVPNDFSDRLMNYLRSRLARATDDPSDLEEQAYECYVLALDGHPDVGTMSRLTDLLSRPPIENVPQPTAETAFHLAAAWAAIHEQPRADQMVPRLVFTPRQSRDESGNISSPVREQAVMLSTLLSVKPDHPQIPKLARALAQAGRKGEWRSTQDAAFAVMALGKYARSSKNDQPFHHAELLSGDRLLASSDNGQPLHWSCKPADSVIHGPLTVRIDGDQSRGYVDWLCDGVPLKPAGAAVNEGMEISRKYLDEDNTVVDPSAVRSGELIRVELTLKCPQAVAGVVIEDLLPAGLEPENPRLESSQKEDGATDSSTFAANRQDFRDDRVSIFGDVIAPGTYHCSYLARAVTAGTFTVPPVRAECMYDTATHGISAAGTTMTILPRLSNLTAKIE
ncbi:MAG: hypothetical protein JO353_04515, partial [Phycisphaerae bacterium]|nr:hypothetical protein [Phycisphaerae bacterium]